MTINEIQDEIIEEFSELDDWLDRYQLLIDLGNDQQPLPQQEKTESNLIDGCQSRVWLVCDERDGILYFRAESDALIVKGIISLLVKVLSGHTPAEILEADRPALNAQANAPLCLGLQSQTIIFFLPNTLLYIYDF